MALVSVVFLCASLTSVTAVDVSTKYGTVRGQTLELNTGFRVNTFLGIPFAKPPMGELRWKVPEEPNPWSEPFIADRYGHMCPQTGEMMGSHPWNDYDEDCLHLNVYAPNNSAASGPYPVMVWYHGGSYRGGGSVLYFGHFHAEQDVVVVVANYRLGILGFMSTADDAVTPNAGMYDQLQALKFVKENIAAFGGDPNRVTIFGQSSGGTAVGIHLVSSKSEGYFHRAITLSGNEMISWAYGSRAQRPERLTRAVAAKLDCNRTSNVDMVKCLRDVNATTLVTTSPGYIPNGPESGFSPVVDGEGGFLPDDADKLREQGRYSKVPLMTGITTEDGAGGAASHVPEIKEGGLNRSEYQRILRRVVKSAYQNADPYRQEQAYQAFLHQYTDWPHVDDKERNRHVFVKINTDRGFGLDLDRQVKSHSKDSPTYLLFFGYRSANLTDDITPLWKGCGHSGDMPYVFGRPQLQRNPAVAKETGLTYRVQYNDEDVEYSEYVIKLYTNFAKTGNPTPEPVPAPGSNPPTVWPAFTNANIKHALLKRKIETGDHYRQRNFALYNSYIPWILTHDITARDEWSP